MSNVLSEEKKKQVIALGQLGWALRRIEKETGIRRETASGYLKAAGIEIRRSGGWGKGKAKPANEVTPDSAVSEMAKPAKPEPSTRSSASNCEPYREMIELGLSKGRNAKSIWQDMVDQTGFTGAYQSVKRYVGKLRGGQSLEACGIILTAPGEESQVDYGEGPMVRDAVTGKYRRTRWYSPRT